MTTDELKQACELAFEWRPVSTLPTECWPVLYWVRLSNGVVKRAYVGPVTGKLFIDIGDRGGGPNGPANEHELSAHGLSFTHWKPYNP